MKSPGTPKPASYLDVNGIRLHYERSGEPREDRPTLVLVHGFGASHRVWDDIYPALALRNPTLRLDLKGFGFSAKPDDHAYRPDDQAELLAAFLVQIPDARVVLIGHSYGAGVSLLAHIFLAESEPARNPVVGFVLIAAAVLTQELPFFVRNLRNPFRRFLTTALTTPEWRSRHVLERIFFDKTRATPERVQRYAWFLRLEGAGRALGRVADQIELAAVQDIASRLHTVDLPVLLIWGEADSVIPVEQGRELRLRLPRAELRVLPGTGHVPHEERPLETLEILQAFLERFRANSP